MLFHDFAKDYLEPLEKTSKKLEQTEILSRFFKQAKPEHVAEYLYLILGQTGPIYDNHQYYFGLEFMLYALARLLPKNAAPANPGLFGDSGLSEYEEVKKYLKTRYKKIGDIGALAFEVASEAHHDRKQLSVEDVVARLFAITKVGGEGSQEEKVRLVSQLLSELDPLSTKYVARTIMGQLRLGFSDKTLLDALSWYLSGDKSQREQLDDAYQRHPDIGAVARAVLEGGVEKAVQLDAELGIPIVPALCDRLKSADEMIAKMGEVFVDPKYDGTRFQIHWRRKDHFLRSYTRNLEESTAMFPELPNLLTALKADEVILDGEAVGYDPQNTENLVTFQQTIKRKRKHEIAETMAAIPLRFFIFDILYKDGKSLLRLPLSQRREVLEKTLPTDEPDIALAPTIRTNDPEEIRQMHEKQLKLGLEGIVVKRVDGPYQSGRKAFNWVKLKETEGSAAKLSDTIDAVVLGYYFGRGKRTAFGVGAFLVGIYDEQNDKIVTIAKIGTGLSDEQWRELKERTEKVQKSTHHERWNIEMPEHLTPDVVLEPSIVVEVAADEITQSPTHTAGVALRFPRLVRFRDDKSVRDITTTKELSKIRISGGK